ncbi:MAG: polysaccharide deacetylase family protein [Acetatifactor sp.]|nr:polysaccharide deacetylase family protein [Acetatifactor sp.]
MNGALIVSLDFELFWGMHDCVSLEKYEANIIGARKAIPDLLELFKRYNVHATWATVGFLFAENIEEINECCPKMIEQPSYENSKINSYRLLNMISQNEKTAPEYYAKSLIKLISSYDNQEIASHTFSHYYCCENGQTVRQFREDLKAAQTIARKNGFEIKSLVFPRNQCDDEYIKVLKDFGITSYRGLENNWIHHLFRGWLLRLFRFIDVYIPISGKKGTKPYYNFDVLNIYGTRMYKPMVLNCRLLEYLKIRRIKKTMKAAAKRKEIFHLWWHPHNIGINTSFYLKQLEDIFSYYTLLKRKYGFSSMTMEELSNMFKDNK